MTLTQNRAAKSELFLNRYLELQSSGRKDEIRFHYKVQQEVTAKMETFPFRLADNEWHKVAVSVSGAQVELLVDCHPLYRRIIRPLDRNFTVPQLGLWVGQRSRGHSYFKVSLQQEKFLLLGFLAPIYARDMTGKSVFFMWPLGM